MRLAQLLDDLAPCDPVVVDAGRAACGLPVPLVVGRTTVVVLEEPVRALPLGRLVDAVCTAEADVLAVVDLDAPAHRSAIVLGPLPQPHALPVRWRRVEGVGLVALEGAAARRDLVETQLDAVVQRALALHLRDAGAREAARALAAEADAEGLRRDVANVTASLAALRASRAYEVGLALQEVRRRPVPGLVHLPGALRRAGRGPSSR